METSIGHRGPSANLNLEIKMPAQGLGQRIDEHSRDLIRIAAYVFGADQQIRRGGAADVFGEDWQRDFTLCIPVGDPAFWSKPVVQASLEETLNFVSDDKWHFRFTKSRPEEIASSMFDFDPSESLGRPEAVVLFSGGMDSLCAVIEQIAVAKKRPLLIGHSPAFHLGARQTDLRSALRLRFPEWHFPVVNCAVHRIATDAPETSHRTRSFLYAAFGTAVARALRLDQVHLADNGVVSLNLPINDQLVGARASRSTHPRFITLFNQFASNAFGKPPRLENPLWSRTRAETLSILKQANAESLLEGTNSCARQRGRTGAQPHCGTCSQCIDRRFATLAMGLEEHDHGERYEVDIFRHPLPEGDARTMAASYVRFANEVSELTGNEMFHRFPQLFDCVPKDESQAVIAEALTDMIRRHGTEVMRVMREQTVAAGDDLVRQRLPESSLIVLVAGQTVRSRSPKISQTPHREDAPLPDAYGRWRKRLTPPQRAVVKHLEQARETGEEPTRWSELKATAIGAGGNPTRMQDVFKYDEVWREFVTQPHKGYWQIA
ncbi:MAG: 7-cyano-7-deazaguanine synthase [Chloroflexi bacterium]|nr:7-cyano-7-deazaguanine synthase [Chloroflexota bacterium]